jgi:protein-disulfide isomerase
MIFRPLASLAFAIGILAASAAPGYSQNPAQAERPDDHAIGSTDAPLTIVEYASFACPHCAHYQIDAWPTVNAEFVETGLVRYIYRPMLTSPPQIAAIGMVLAECAADEEYFDAVDLLFTEQSNIFQTAQDGGDVIAIYDRIAAAVGVSPEQLSACFGDPAMNEMVNADAQQASADGISGTPTFIIGGKVLSTEPTVDGLIFTWGGAPLLIDGQRVPGQLDGDSFRRIILHFLEMSESGQ